MVILKEWHVSINVIKIRSASMKIRSSTASIGEDLRSNFNYTDLSTLSLMD